MLHTGLANVGAILHPIITLHNAERIARGDSFDFYTEGVTARVASVLAAADAERLSVARAYGAAVDSIPDWIAAAYGHRAGTMQAAVAGNPAYVGIKAPATLAHRYLLEDVPTGLIPLLDLGRAAGLALPTLARLVSLARIALTGQRWQRPRTLETLGLGRLDVREIRSDLSKEIRGFSWRTLEATAFPGQPVVSMPRSAPCQANRCISRLLAGFSLRAGPPST